MSSKNKNIILFLATSFFGILGIIETSEILSHSSSSIIPSWWQLFMFFGCLWAIIYSIDYLLDKKGRKQPFYRSVWAIFFYAFIIVILGISNMDCFKAETLIYARSNFDLGGISILLRKDNTSEVTLSGIFDSETFRNKYALVGDTIFFDKPISSEIDHSLSPKMLVKENVIYRLDSNDQITNYSAQFFIEH